jgi:hypothetical protein
MDRRLHGNFPETAMWEVRREPDLRMLNFTEADFWPGISSEWPVIQKQLEFGRSSMPIC